MRGWRSRGSSVCGYLVTHPCGGIWEQMRFGWRALRRLYAFLAAREGSGRTACALLLLNRLEVGNDRPDFLRREYEFRHVRMAGGKAFRERFAEALDLVPVREGSERRRVGVRTLAGAADRVAAGAIRRQQRLAARERRGAFLGRSGCHRAAHGHGEEKAPARRRAHRPCPSHVSSTIGQMSPLHQMLQTIPRTKGRHELTGHAFADWVARGGLADRPGRSAPTTHTMLAQLLLAPARAVRPVDAAVADDAEHVEGRAGADRRRAGQICMALLAALVLEIDGVAGLGQREVLARLAGVGLRLAAVIAAQVRRGRLRLRLAGDEAERGRK